MPDDPTAPRPFKPLGSYTYPDLPADDLAKSFWERLKNLTDRTVDPPIISEDLLRKASRDQLGDHVAAPICDLLMADLDVTLCDWADTRTHDSPLKVLVLPPCEPHNIVEVWARRRNREVLQPPDRNILLEELGVEKADLRGDGVLIIPRLEDWFLRCRTGLTQVRSLLSGLASLERQCLIGCNSWAWPLLCKSIEADLVMPQPLCFQAFDAERLRAWFTSVMSTWGQGTTFRLPETDQLLGPDGEDAVAMPYFRKLAGQSLGIPWVAWWMWRNSLRSRRPEKKDDAKTKGDGDETKQPEREPDEPSPEEHAAGWGKTEFFLAPIENHSVPMQHQPDELLVLHALLIHGPLAPEELEAVLPTMRHASITSALVGAGLVQRSNGHASVKASAYPAVRRALSGSAFPLDRL